MLFIEDSVSFHWLVWRQAMASNRVVWGCPFMFPNVYTRYRSRCVFFFVFIPEIMNDVLLLFLVVLQRFSQNCLTYLERGKQFPQHLAHADLFMQFSDSFFVIRSCLQNNNNTYDLQHVDIWPMLIAVHWVSLVAWWFLISYLMYLSFFYLGDLICFPR